MRIACSWTSLVLRFFVSSVHQILQLCFAGSAILCQFSTLDPAFVLRWFYDSLSVQYVRFRKSATVLRWFCDSSSVPYIRFRDPAFVLRWFYDSLSVQYIRSCFSILQVCFANSSILRRFHFRNCTSFSGLPPILRFFAGFVNPAAGFANSSILSLVPLADPASFAAILFSRYRIFISQ